MSSVGTSSVILVRTTGHNGFEGSRSTRPGSFTTKHEEFVASAPWNGLDNDLSPVNKSLTFVARRCATDHDGARSDKSPATAVSP